MDAHIIILIIMGAALLAWVIWCAVGFARSGSRLAAGKGLVAHLRCERCGHRFDTDAAEVMRPGFTKRMTVTRTRREGAALVDEPHHRSFARRLACPACGERSWVQVENANELNRAIRPDVLRVGVRQLGLTVAGGAIILLLANIVLAVVRLFG